MKENHFSPKMRLKSYEELIAIIKDEANYTLEARQAAAWVLESHHPLKSEFRSTDSDNAPQVQEPVVVKSPIGHTLPKLYSERGIGVATVLGGPLAGAMLARQNFLQLGKYQDGQRSLWLGITGIALVLMMLVLIPEQILEKIPGFLFALPYTVLLLVFVNKYHGEDLKNHKQSNGPFHSGWRAAGMGLLWAIPFVVVVLGFVAFGYYQERTFDSEAYNRGLTQFQINEEKALEAYLYLENYEYSKAVKFINRTGVPMWEHNIEILNGLDNLEGLPEDLKYQNHQLREYCQLRVETYKLLSRAVSEDNFQEDHVLDAKLMRIDSLLNLIGV